jgi:hypothetical protein
MGKLTLVHNRSWPSSHQRFKVCQSESTATGSGTGSARRRRHDLDVERLGVLVVIDSDHDPRRFCDYSRERGV